MNICSSALTQVKENERGEFRGRGFRSRRTHTNHRIQVRAPCFPAPGFSRVERRLAVRLNFQASGLLSGEAKGNVVRHLNPIQRSLRETGNYAYISLSHISHSDITILNQIARTEREPTMIGKTTHGFIVSLLSGQPKGTAEQTVGQFIALGFSSEFVLLWEELHMAGYGLVWFDPLGQIINDLPTFGAGE